MRRIAITGASSPLGRALLDRLRDRPDTEFVHGLELKDENDAWGDLEIIPFVPDHRPMAEYLDKQGVDTVIQCGLVPDRSGVATRAREADVIATMCLGAAIAQAGSRVRNWVLASSSGVYPIGSHAALLQREDQRLSHASDSQPGSIAEAEDYARDVAYRLAHVNVAILRLQELVGEDVRGPLSSLLGRDPVPLPIGFDPTFQLLHLEDATDALAFAAIAELAGVYNVASNGSVHLHDAIQFMGRASFPVIPMRAASLEPLLERLRVPHLPDALVDLMRFGHVVDTRKIEQVGWRARFDQTECLSMLRER